MFEKISGAEVNEILKTSAATLRAISEENESLKEKVAHFEKKEQAEKIANLMEEKGIQPELSFQEKVASIMVRENLSVLEEAITLSAAQVKLASVHDDDRATVEGDPSGDAATRFVSNLMSAE